MKYLRSIYEIIQVCNNKSPIPCHPFKKWTQTWISRCINGFLLFLDNELANLKSNDKFIFRNKTIHTFILNVVLSLAVLSQN